MSKPKNFAPPLFLEFFCLTLLVVTIPIIGIFRHGSFLIPLLFALAPLLYYKNISEIKARAISYLKCPIALTLWSFAGLCLTSTIWSVLPQQTFKVSFQFIALIALSVWLYATVEFYQKFSSQIFKILIGAFFIGSILILSGHYDMPNWRSLLGMHHRVLKPNMELLSILAIPLCFYIYHHQKKLTALALGILTLYLCYVFDIRASFYGLIIGFLSMAFWYYYPRLAFWITSSGLTVYTFSLPFFFKSFDYQPYVKDMVMRNGSSFLHRIITWKFAATKTFEKFWLGWGGMSSKGFPEITVVNVLEGHEPWNALPAHTHNIFVQAWLELGFSGNLLLLCFFIITAYTISKNPNQNQRTALGVLLASVVPMLSLSHSLWHTWWTSWIGFCGFLCLMLSNQKSHKL